MTRKKNKLVRPKQSISLIAIIVDTIKRLFIGERYLDRELLKFSKLYADQY
jgi:hypothetical protein